MLIGVDCNNYYIVLEDEQGDFINPQLRSGQDQMEVDQKGKSQHLEEKDTQPFGKEGKSDFASVYRQYLMGKFPNDLKQICKFYPESSHLIVSTDKLIQQFLDKLMIGGQSSATLHSSGRE